MTRLRMSGDQNRWFWGKGTRCILAVINPTRAQAFHPIFSLAKDAVALTFGLWVPYFTIRSPSVSGSRRELRDGPAPLLAVIWAEVYIWISTLKQLGPAVSSSPRAGHRMGSDVAT